MTIIDRIAARFGYARPPQHVRRFEAAIINRLTAGWLGTTQSIDEELKGDLDRLRARSRDLAANNDYVRKFLKMVQANVVGPSGFTLQARVENAPNQPDKWANDAIEAAFAKWAGRNHCDIGRRQSFAEMCRALIADVARDGEALVYRVRGKAAGNPYNYALQRLDVARIATTHNQIAAGGRNPISLGIETTPAGTPVALWLYKANPGSSQGPRDIERIPIDDIFHLFVAERPEQTRGFPWLHTAMQRLHQLKGYEEAAVIAARVGAAKMGFFTSPDGTAADLGEKDDSGEFVTSADAGEFQVLPQGYDFKSFDPDYPHQQFGEFVKSTLRGIASGLNISYNTLANDLEGVNFSSIRSGVLEEREQWMTIQRWFVESFLITVFEEWLDAALLSGAIIQQNGSALPVAKAEKFKAHAWQGRRWAWVDPLKDIEASVVAIENGLASPYTIAAQMGVDIEDVLDDIARFQAAVEAKKIRLGKPAEQPAKPSEQQDDAIRAIGVRVARFDAEITDRLSRLEKTAAPSITVAPVINTPEVRVDVQPAAVTVHPQEVRVDVQPPAVTVQPAEVRVEAILPAQDAPSVTVNVEAAMPERMEMAITEMPTRQTTSEVVRDADKNIVKTTQIESDKE